MTKVKKAVTALGLMLALAMGVAQRAQAFPNANLDLLVSFTANLSVNIDGVQYSTRTLGALTAGQTFVPSSATVNNDSNGLTEQFQLSGADVSTTAVTLWSLVTTTGSTAGGNFCAGNIGAVSCPQQDQYALQALFISSANTTGCPSAVTGDWDQYMSTVGVTGVTYTSNIYADTSAGFGNNGGGTGNPDQISVGHNGNMFSNKSASNGQGRRGLCVRLTMPSASTSVNTHVLRLTITAGLGT